MSGAAAGAPLVGAARAGAPLVGSSGGRAGASHSGAPRAGASRAGASRAGASRVGAAPSRAARTIILSLVGLVFAVPILAMIEFTFRDGLSGTYTLKHWTNLADPTVNVKYAPLATALSNSLALVLVTVALVLVLLLPTMILVELRFAKLRRVIEFVCIVPITVPAIVLVVGLVPVYSVVVKIAGSSVWTLGFAYGITVLPYAYRAIQANLGTVDVVTLSEAGRSLGAGWSTVLFRIILPNLRRGVLAASFISVAVVLGEFTIASLLNRVNLQTALVLISKSDPYVAVIFSLLALAFAFVLLLLIGRISVGGGGRRGRRGAAGSRRGGRGDAVSRRGGRGPRGARRGSRLGARLGTSGARGTRGSGSSRGGALAASPPASPPAPDPAFSAAPGQASSPAPGQASSPAQPGAHSRKK